MDGLVTARGCLPKQPDETVQLLLKTKMLVSCKKGLAPQRHDGVMKTHKQVLLFLLVLILSCLCSKKFCLLVYGTT